MKIMAQILQISKKFFFPSKLPDFYDKFQL